MSKKSSQHRIQDPSISYSLLKYAVDSSLFNAYREIVYKGLDKIPTDGAIIFAPNHTNALMDALLVLALDQKPKVFVARADIFRNKFVARILSFLKMMPIMRLRDGIDEVKKNDETIHRAVEVLMDKVPFCILPEGKHRAQHSLLPLTKGIFRIAIQAQEVMGDKMPLYIIPLGIEYGNFFRFRSTALVQVGEPMNVREYLHQHSDITQPELMNLMKTDLAERLKKVILYIPDDERYNETYELCANLIHVQISEMQKENPKEQRISLPTRFKANRRTVGEVLYLRQNHPEIANELFKKAEKVRSDRIRKHISLGSVTTRHPLWAGLLKTVIFLVTLPYTIPASIVALPVTGTSRLIVKLMKIKDRSFLNSIRFAVNFLVWPIIIIVYAIIFFCLFPWLDALLLTAISIPTSLVANDAFRLTRLLISDFKLRFDSKLRKDIAQLRSFYMDKVKL